MSETLVVNNKFVPTDFVNCNSFLALIRAFCKMRVYHLAIPPGGFTGGVLRYDSKFSLIRARRRLVSELQGMKEKYQ